MKTNIHLTAFLLAIGIFASSFAAAQTGVLPGHPVYLDTAVATVRIIIDPDSLAAIYNPANSDSDHEYPATFIFDNPVIHDTVLNVGFRLRGNTSRDSRKKSFKVSINAFEHGRKFYGLEKLNLNGEHNDPSIIRSKLSWDLFSASGVAASRANHTRLYINGQYYGLYINVEHVDENFVLARFGNNNGNLYKCLWPADLAYLGSDPDLYKAISGARRTYELSINEEIDDYSDLANFISILNLTPADSFPTAIQRVFNVNGFLRSLAVDIATGSWDDYWFLKNNYYLYHNTATGRFEFIPYDYDNTFGIWWTSILSGVDWGTRPIYSWGDSTQARPLVSRLLTVQTFRDRLSFYLNRLLQRHFVESSLFPRIDTIHAMITPAAEADSFRRLDYGFTIQQFHDSYTQALGMHVMYGLKQYVTTRRTSALSQLQLNNVAPILTELTFTPLHPFHGDEVVFTVRVEDEALPQFVLLHLTVNGIAQSPLTMYDDGLHNDVAPGDEIYGAVLGAMPSDAIVGYYVSSADALADTSYEPSDAPATMGHFFVNGATPRLFINEFMASNDTTILDPFGEVEDWIEIYNGDSVSISLGNWYLTDNFSNPGKWKFPDTTIAPGAVMLIWADDNASQGPLHAAFKLGRDGERIGLYRGDSLSVATVDTISFGYQQTDVSYGRVPDGGTWMSMVKPTPGYSNVITDVVEDNLLPEVFELSPPYPNPFNPAVTISYRIPRSSQVRMAIFDVLGREVESIVDEYQHAGAHTVTWNGIRSASGIYIVRLSAGTDVKISKVLLLK